MIWLKENYFKVLMWGLFFLIIWSFITILTSNEGICGQDNIYDYNCGDLYLNK